MSMSSGKISLGKLKVLIDGIRSRSDGDSFHCVYWPAFLMALDLPLPRRVLAHGYWKINHEKMSKSTGNVVNPFFAIDRFGADTMRFYLARNGSTVEDSNYDNSYIIACYKKMLQWGIGNLTSRTIGCAKGNLRSFIVKAASDELPPATPRDEEYQASLEKLPIEVAEHMENLDIHAAVKAITGMIDQVSVAQTTWSLLILAGKQVFP